MTQYFLKKRYHHCHMGILNSFFQDCLNVNIFNHNETQIMCRCKMTTSKLFAWLITEVAFSWVITVQLQAHRRFLYTYTMGVIAILNVSATLRPVLNKTACHFTGFTDVQPLNVAPVIDVGIVFLLHRFANMKSLNTVIVLNAIEGAIISRMSGRYVHVQVFGFFFASVLDEVTGVRFHCVWRQTTLSVCTEFNAWQ